VTQSAAALESRIPDAVTFSVQFVRPIPLPGTVRLLTWVRDGVRAEVRSDPDDRCQLIATVTERR
jgi:hypothetical protein